MQKKIMKFRFIIVTDFERFLKKKLYRLFDWYLLKIGPSVIINYLKFKRCRRSVLHIDFMEFRKFSYHYEN